MSLSGNAAMAVLRLMKPGKGSFADEEKSRRKADKENKAFRFFLPARLPGKPEMLQRDTDADRRSIAVMPRVKWRIRTYTR